MMVNELLKYTESIEDIVEQLGGVSSCEAVPVMNGGAGGWLKCGFDVRIIVFPGANKTAVETKAERIVTQHLRVAYGLDGVYLTMRVKLTYEHLRR